MIIKSVVAVFFFSGGFPQEFYIALFLGQFVLMYLVFDAILYRKKAGLIYRLTRSCSADKGNLSDYFIAISFSYITHAEAQAIIQTN